MKDEEINFCLEVSDFGTAERTRADHEERSIPGNGTVERTRANHEERSIPGKRDEGHTNETNETNDQSQTNSGTDRTTRSQRNIHALYIVTPFHFPLVMCDFFEKRPGPFACNAQYRGYRMM